MRNIMFGKLRAKLELSFTVFQKNIYGPCLKATEPLQREGFFTFRPPEVSVTHLIDLRKLSRT